MTRSVVITAALALAFSAPALAQEKSTEQILREFDNFGTNASALIFDIVRPLRPEDQAITITGPKEKLVVSIHMDGSVEIGDGFTADDAAREFWKHLAHLLPNKCEVPK